MMNKKYYVMVLLPLFSLCAEATQTESPLGKSLPGEMKKNALQEYLHKNPDDITDIDEARKIIEVLQRAAKKVLAPNPQNAHLKTTTSATEREKPVSRNDRGVIQKAEGGPLAPTKNSSTNHQAISRKPTISRFINDPTGVSPEAKAVYDETIVKLKERIERGDQLRKVEKQELSLKSITDDAVVQAIQAIKSGNGNANTLAELVRKKIQQLGFRTDDYKVKEFIYSFLRELKQGQGLGVDPIVEIYYAIMKEKPSLLIKRQIQTEINRE